jgi:tyrosinase
MLTRNLQTVPPSDNVTLDTPVNFGAISGPKKIRDLVSTIDGEFCYLYD